MAVAPLFPTQPLPFSHISGWTFYSPRNPPKEPDDISRLLSVDGIRSGYKPHLILGDLADGFLASVSCTSCKGILNEPISNDDYKFCKRCSQIPATIDHTLTRTIQNFVMYCPLYQRGCDWAGPIKSSYVHLEKECSFVYLKCSYIQMGLCLHSQPMMRRDLMEHCKQTHAPIEKILSEMDSLKIKLLSSNQEKRLLLFENRFLKQTYDNGEILVRILNFENWLGETFTCPIFQTHPPSLIETAEGYSLQVIITISNDKSVSAAITIRDGHCDDILPWPMLVNYAATIYSFNDDTQNVECRILCSDVPQALREKGSTQAPGWSPLITYQDICNRVLLKNQTMYLKFKICFI